MLGTNDRARSVDIILELLLQTLRKFSLLLLLLTLNMQLPTGLRIISDSNKGFGLKNTEPSLNFTSSIKRI